MCSTKRKILDSEIWEMADILSNHGVPPAGQGITHRYLKLLDVNKTTFHNEAAIRRPFLFQALGKLIDVIYNAAREPDLYSPH